MPLLHTPSPAGAPHLGKERFVTDHCPGNGGLQGRRSNTLLSTGHLFP